MLPGGILNKGIVRGYAGALGLDPQDWTERFMRAYGASGQPIDDEQGWDDICQQCGQSAIAAARSRRDRLRWIGAGLLVLAVIAATFLCVRYYGVQAGWWTTLLPFGGLGGIFHAIWSPVHGLLRHIFGHSKH